LGYSGYTLSGDNLYVPTGAFGDRSYTITGNEIIYTVKILNPSETGISSFDYNGSTYSGTDQNIDTFTITSPDLNIMLTNITYAEGFEGSDEIFLDVIESGSTGNKEYSLKDDVKNVYIDLDTWTNEVATHYKVSSFEYNGKTYDTSDKNIIWIDYFIETSPPLYINITNINYRNGYTGPSSYDFGTVDPSVEFNNVTYNMNFITLVPYKVYIKKDSTVTSFRYRTGFTTYGSLVPAVTTNDLIEVEFTIQSKLNVVVFNTSYATGYEGYNNGPTANPTTILYDSTNYDRASDIGSAVDPILVTYDKLTNYTITINKTDPDSKLANFSWRVQYEGGENVSNNVYTILSESINVTAIDFVYQTGTNTDGIWTLFTGPSQYGYDDGVNTT
jgi:hypothetical protein